MNLLIKHRFTDVENSWLQKGEGERDKLEGEN